MQNPLKSQTLLLNPAASVQKLKQGTQKITRRRHSSFIKELRKIIIQ